MAKRPGTGPSETPQSFPEVTPKDLYQTSDIRFVMMEVGKLTANVDRLIDDVKGHGDKLDALRHQATAVKAWIAASTLFIGLFIGLAGFLISGKGDAIMAAVHSISAVPPAIPQSPPVAPQK